MVKSIEGLTYYSETFDVLVWGDEDEPLSLIASFATRKDANTYAQTRNDVVVIRPPRSALAHALAWTTYLLALTQGESVADAESRLRPAY